MIFTSQAGHFVPQCFNLQSYHLSSCRPVEANFGQSHCFVGSGGVGSSPSSPLFAEKEFSSCSSESGVTVQSGSGIRALKGFYPSKSSLTSCIVLESSPLTRTRLNVQFGISYTSVINCGLVNSFIVVHYMLFCKKFSHFLFLLRILRI